MVLSLANALKLTVIIISSILSQPIRIDPQDVAIAVPLFLSFCQYGAGHYDAVIMKSIKVNETTTMCRCGNNDKNSNKHRCTSVIVQSQKYSSCCPCFRTSKACGKKCKCKGCGNPYGMHKDTKVLKRKRHGRSRFKVYVTSDREFLSSRQEILRKGKFSQLEYFAFSEILKRMDKKDICSLSNGERNTVLTKVHDCISAQCELAH